MSACVYACELRVCAYIRPHLTTRELPVWIRSIRAAHLQQPQASKKGCSYTVTTVQPSTISTTCMHQRVTSPPASSSAHLCGAEPAEGFNYVISYFAFIRIFLSRTGRRTRRRREVVCQEWQKLQMWTTSNEVMTSL